MGICVTAVKELHVGGGRDDGYGGEEVRFRRLKLCRFKISNPEKEATFKGINKLREI